MKASWQKAVEAFDYDGRRSERDQLRTQCRYRGIGVAAYTHMCGMAPSRRLALAQIAADVLQVPIEDIDVVQGDTKQVQAGHGTFNSRSIVRYQASGHADDAAARLVGGSKRTLRRKPMIPALFDYVRATSLAEAVALLQKDTDGSKLVAGGHTLIPTIETAAGIAGAAD
jgi:CO/xanthine dehydrogenase Mo-binding subunit